MSLYLVDWDLRASQHKDRARFYRRLQKIMKELNGDSIAYSSDTVRITTNKELAHQIHKTAKDCGASSTFIYEITGLKVLKEHEDPKTIDERTRIRYKLRPDLEKKKKWGMRK